MLLLSAKPYEGKPSSTADELSLLAVLGQQHWKHQLQLCPSRLSVRLESCVLLPHRSQANNACHSAQGETPSPVQWHLTHCSLCWLGSAAGNSASGESNWNSALVLPMTQTSPCTEAFIISQHLQQCSYHLTSLFLKYIHTKHMFLQLQLCYLDLALWLHIPLLEITACQKKTLEKYIGRIKKLASF